MSALWPPPSPRWSSLDQLAADTLAFEQVWWRGNDDVADACAIDPGLRARLEVIAATRPVNTSDVHRYDDPRDTYRPARATVHARIADGARRGTPVPRPAPVAHLTIGCPGAGKTTLLRPLAHAHRQLFLGTDPGVVIVDADAVRCQLPEYGDGVGSETVAQECFDITYDKVYRQARLTGHDVIFDAMGRRATTEQVVGELLSAGYDIHLLLAQVPLAQCRQRTDQRALRDGRFMPHDLQQHMHTEAERTYRLLTDGHVPLSGWAVVDTSMDTGRLRLLESGGTWADDGEDIIRMAVP